MTPLQHGYNMFEFLKEHRQSLGGFIRQLHNICLLTDMYGNIGDHLIWGGTLNFLDTLGVEYCKISTRQISNCEQIDTRNACLLISGSGAFDKRWHEWLPQLVIDASKTFERVIILPSQFDISVPIVKECLSIRNVFAFAREPTSYRAIKYTSNASLAFDCALYFDFEKYMKFTSKGLLCVLRDDAGSIINRKNYSISAINNDISLTTHSLDEWIMYIAQAAIIITDRLHVAVASVMLQKELIYIDPYNKKISTYLDYVFSKSASNEIRKVDINWLLNNEYINKVE